MRSLFALLCFLSQARAADQPLQVVSKAPFGRTESENASLAITATFNQPMVPLSSPGEMSQACPLSIFPETKGRCRWRGTQSVAFEPEGPLAPATLYRATLPKGTKSLVSGSALSEDVSWEFETVRPSVVDSVPRHGDKWIGLDGELFVFFNSDMDPLRARDFIALQESGLDGTGLTETLPAGVRRATPEEIKKLWSYSEQGVSPSTANVLAVKPARALSRDKAYSLHLKEGLPGARGELGLLFERVVSFETWYTFRLAQTPVANCMPQGFGVWFSNPVRYGDFLEHLSVEPSTPIPAAADYRAESSGSRDPSRRLVELELPELGYKPETSYTFKVRGDLKDLFGNALGKNEVFTVRTGGYCPSLTMPEGFGVLESYLPARHPVDVINVPSVRLEKARIKDEDFIPFFKKVDWSCNKPQKLTGAVAKDWLLGNEHNVSLRTFIDMGGPGLTFAQLQSPSRGWGGRTCWIKALDDVTRIGLTSKNSPDSTLVWAAFLKTGSPAPNVPIELRDGGNKVVWTGKTDAQGFADAPGWKKLGLSWEAYQKPNLWVFAKDPQGTAVLSMDSKSELSPWRFNIYSEWYPKPEYYRGSLFTERGIYRPGETVRFKAILRKLDNGDWSVLGSSDPKVMQLTVTNSRESLVMKTTVTLSAQSSFDFSFPINEQAPTGEWTAKVTELLPEKPAEELVSVQGKHKNKRRHHKQTQTRIELTHYFRVEAFKPASFEVKVMPTKDSFIAGDTYYASVDGWYLFGAPMADAPADWKLRLEPGGWSPPGYDGFAFEPGWWEREAETGRLAASSAVKLDAQGKAAVAAKLEAGNSLAPLVAVLEAGVSSPDRQRLFGRATATVHRADLYFGIRPSSSFLEKGKKFSAQIIAVRPDGVKANGIAGEGRLLRRDWLSAQKAGVGGRLEWVSEQRDTIVSTFSFVSTPSTFTWTFVPSEPGQYYFSVSGRDEQGRATESATSFYVTGSGEAWWSRADTDIIELVADKKSYKPGETARILVKSPYARSRALITLEREGIIARWTTMVAGGATFINVPIKDNAVPNVAVGVILLQGRGKDSYAADGEDMAKPQAKFGYINLAVDPGGRRLKLEVASDLKQYRPGQKVTVSLKTKNEAGLGAPAELTVFAVDEGVLALTGYATPDVFGAFYGERPLLVATADSRLNVIGQRSYGEKGKKRGGGGGGGANLEGVDLRSRFVPTAYWNPTVKTGADGTASVSFNLPDNLSRFRVMAVAHAGKRFGSGESRLTVSKPLLLRPSLPRVARVEDEFEGGVVVHNYSSSAAVVTVELKTDGDAIKLEGEARRQVSVAAGKASEVLWKCRAVKIGTTAFQFRAKAGKESDGLEWKVAVRFQERLERTATSGVVQDSPVEEALARPKGKTAVNVGLSPTALSGLQEGARYLLEYPYGCLEQRLSRIMPVITGADLTATFGLGSMGDLKAETQKTLDRLPDFVAPSGGFAYWPSPDLADPFITAYALEAAALARKEGYRVPEETIRRAVAWLKGSLANEKDWAYPYNQSEAYASRAYSLYALTLHNEYLPGYLKELFDRRDQLPFLAKAYVLKASKLLMNAPITPDLLAAELLNQARLAPRSLHFEEPEGSRMPWIHESSVKTTAVVLQALLEAKGGFPNDEKAIFWLTQERKNKGRWRSTQENADSLRVFQDFYRRYEKEEPDFTAKVSSLWSETFKGRTLLGRSKDFDGAAVFGSTDKATVRFSKEGTGRLYYTLGISYTPGNYEPASEGMTIEKKVTPLYGQTLRAGARAKVTLTVKTPMDRTFVAVDDPIPAGFEIVDPSFAVESREDAAEVGRGQYWGSFQRNEKYDDRIQLFADYLTAGEHTYSYLVQATTPGKFRQPATWIEQMYEPEVFGRTGTQTVEVEK